MFFCRIFSLSFFLGACLSGISWAQNPSQDERLFDVEAQVATLKNDIAETKALAAQERPSAFNPSISVIGDILGQYGVNVPKKAPDKKGHQHGFENGLNVRELEFEFRGSIDPWADALVVVAIEQHHINDFDIGVEEAYARLKKWPGIDFAPFGTEMRVGKFKTALGRMNRIHMHNIPQITYPLAMRVFLDDEGYASQGISFNSSWAYSSKGALSWVLEGVIGSKLPMQEKESRSVPNGIAHLWWHQELSENHYLDIGASSLVGRNGKRGSGAFWLGGADFHYSYLPAGYGQNPVFLLGSEFYFANKETNGRWPFGNFTWAQTKMLGSSFVGLRYDIAPQENKLDEFQHALGGYVGLYTSEFLRFRLGYEHVMPTINSLEGDHRFLLSMNFILGSHPVEPYFANR